LQISTYSENGDITGKIEYFYAISENMLINKVNFYLKGENFMNNRSKCLLVATSLATIYVIYLLVHFFGTPTSNDAEAVGQAIAGALVTPHIIMFAIGAIFGWISVFTKEPWGALVAAILYTVATFLFFLYFMFGAPIFILGFIGYSRQKKINNSTQA